MHWFEKIIALQSYGWGGSVVAKSYDVFVVLVFCWVRDTGVVVSLFCFFANVLLSV